MIDTQEQLSSIDFPLLRRKVKMHHKYTWQVSDTSRPKKASPSFYVAEHAMPSKVSETLSPHTPSVENETLGQILHHQQHGSGSDCGLPPALGPCTAQCVQWRAETGLGNRGRLAANWTFRILWFQSQILPLQILKMKLKLTPEEFLKSHDPNVLIYNRIPKTGSSSMLHMIWNLKVS